MAVTVALVRVIDGAGVMAWPVALAPEARQLGHVGRHASAGVAQPAGRYEFRVFDGVAGRAASRRPQAPAALATGAFDLVDHIFPVRGRHTYGSGQAAFGAQRNGHIHQGHDVFARCGTPLVAARGGVVKLNRFERSAGNYVVIDGEGTDVDYVYMHLREPSPLAKGARVLTGQPIGNVGDTGDARGCHLHFELWSGPGLVHRRRAARPAAVPEGLGRLQLTAPARAGAEAGGERARVEAQRADVRRAGAARRAERVGVQRRADRRAGVARDGAGELRVGRALGEDRPHARPRGSCARGARPRRPTPAPASTAPGITVPTISMA